MRYLEVVARLPLPDNTIDSHPIEGGALTIAKKFREEFTAYATKQKVEGATVDANIKKSKPKDAGRANSKPAATDAKSDEKQPDLGTTAGGAPWTKPAA